MGSGLVVRSARPHDVEGIAALLADRAEPADAVDVRLVLDDLDGAEDGLDAVGVALDGERVVATLTLLDEELQVGDVALPAGQIEHVATARSHEGRGLASALMGWAQRRSAARGHLVVVLAGIPDFYRRFGFVGGIRAPATVRLRAGWRPSEATSGITVRSATLADIPALAALQRDAQRACVVRLAHPDHRWRWLLERTGTVQVMAEDESGAAVGSARVTPPEADVVLAGELTATSAPAAEALLGYGVAAADGVSAVHVARPTASVPGLVVDAAGEPVARGRAWFDIALPDPVALLDRLRPVLDERLAASSCAGSDREVVVAVDELSLRWRVADGSVGPVSSGVGVPGVAAARVPTEAWARVLFADGAQAVEAMTPSCDLGDQRDLLGVLFPPVRSDLALLCLP